MKLDYRRDIHNRYLILSPETGEEIITYRLKMIISNEIPGFVPCTYEYMNGTPMLYYAIGGMQPLSVYFNEKRADRAFFGRFTAALLSGLSALGNYLIDPEYMLMMPETILAEPRTGELKFICFPFEKKSMDEQLQVLGSFMLSKAADEAEDIRTAYRFYTACSEKGATAETLMEVFRSFDEQRSGDRSEAAMLPREEPVFFEEEKEPEEPGRSGNQKAKGGSLFFGKFSLAAGKIKNVRKKKEKNRNKKAGAGGWTEYREPVLPGSAVYEEPAFYKEPYQKTREETDEETNRNLYENLCEETNRNLYENTCEETVCLSGYQNVQNGYGSAWLVPVDFFSGESLELTEDVYVVGRGNGPNVLNPGIRAVSRKHAELVRRGNTYELSDLGSKNGTAVNGEKLTAGKPRLLSDGDVLRFADTEYQFCLTDKHNEGYTVDNNI